MTLLEKWDSAKKMWRILELALADLAQVVKEGKYKVDMDVWISPARCTVCLGGAVMCRRLKTSQLHRLRVGDQVKMRTINRLRTGRIRAAYEAFYGRITPKDLTDIDMYSYGHPAWWHRMDQLVAFLKRKDL